MLPCTAIPAPEAELVAAADGLKRLGLNAQDLLEFLLGYRLELEILTDSATGISAVVDAYGVLKYTNRTQGVPLSRLHDVFNEPSHRVTKHIRMTMLLTS